MVHLHLHSIWQNDTEKSNSKTIQVELPSNTQCMVMPLTKPAVKQKARWTLLSRAPDPHSHWSHTVPKMKDPKKHLKNMQEYLPFLAMCLSHHYKIVSSEGFAFLHLLIWHSCFKLSIDFGNSPSTLKPFTRKPQTHIQNQNWRGH